MVYFYDLPVADFTFIQTVNEIKFDNSSSISGSYFWEFGDGITSTEFQPEHVYTQPGRYLVKLTVANDCGISLFTDSITVDHLFSGKLIDFSSIEPNPNNGDFNLHIIVEQQTDAAVSIYGLSGQMIISPENHVLQRGENLLKFSLNTLPDGMYILRLSCNYGQIYQRFFIVTF
ncbi:MAG: PKD domain-containing protein [Bacteroidia bacterium]|nr:PKD domain-containing protein [Bacteroidia bacterium]